VASASGDEFDLLIADGNFEALLCQFLAMMGAKEI